jgi:hypothetical protein
VAYKKRINEPASVQAKHRIGLSDVTTFFHKNEYFFLMKKEKKPASVQ